MSLLNAIQIYLRARPSAGTFARLLFLCRARGGGGAGRGERGGSLSSLSMAAAFVPAHGEDIINQISCRCTGLLPTLLVSELYRISTNLLSVF